MFWKSSKHQLAHLYYACYGMYTDDSVLTKLCLCVLTSSFTITCCCKNLGFCNAEPPTYWIVFMDAKILGEIRMQVWSPCCIRDKDHLKLKILMRLEINYEIHSHSWHKVRKPIMRCIQDDPIMHSYLCNDSQTEIVTMSMIRQRIKEIQSWLKDDLRT